MCRAENGDKSAVTHSSFFVVVIPSCGGNLLVNVGPTKYGEITPVYEERLRQLGAWLAVNGEAIYGTIPWTFQNDTINSDVWSVLAVRGGEMWWC